MLAERREEGECEQGCDRQANQRGQEVPVSSRDAVRQPPPAQAAHPGQDRRQDEHVEGGRETQDAEREGTCLHAIPQCKRAAGRTGRGELQRDEGDRNGSDQQ